METPTHDVNVITVDFKAQVDENQQGSNSRIGPHGAGGTTQLIAGKTWAFTRIRGMLQTDTDQPGKFGLISVSGQLPT